MRLLSAEEVSGFCYGATDMVFDFVFCVCSKIEIELLRNEKRLEKPVFFASIVAGAGFEPTTSRL